MTAIPWNAVLALSAAVLWGGGDFSGGMAVKGAGGSLGAALRIVLISHGTSLCLLLVAAGLRRDPFPQGAVLAWGIVAGLAGGISIALFYIALARGAMGASAAVSGLLAAAIPAMVSATTEGPPGLRKLSGFCAAGFAIWLIAASPASRESKAGQRGTMVLAVVSGAGFGVYFTALRFAGAGGVVWPMATARLGSLALCSLLILAVLLWERRAGVRVAVRWTAVAWVLGTVVLDTGGNMLFIAASRAGRLDVASVLASLYPASTILLAAWMLKEAPTRRQGLGMGVAVAAVALISI